MRSCIFHISTPVFWDCIATVVILLVILLSFSFPFSLSVPHSPPPLHFFPLLIFLAILCQMHTTVPFLNCPFHLKINKWQHIHFCLFSASCQWDSLLVAVTLESKIKSSASHHYNNSLPRPIATLTQLHVI